MTEKKFIDVVFINPSVGNNYQSLKSKYTAIEPPTWSLLLAQSMRNFGFDVSIIDANAEFLSEEQIYIKIKKSHSEKQDAYLRETADRGLAQLK